jgi:hypothetical protein
MFKSIVDACLQSTLLDANTDSSLSLLDTHSHTFHLWDFVACLWQFRQVSLFYLKKKEKKTALYTLT